MTIYNILGAIGTKLCKQFGVYKYSCDANRKWAKLLALIVMDRKLLIKSFGDFCIPEEIALEVEGFLGNTFHPPSLSTPKDVLKVIREIDAQLEQQTCRGFEGNPFWENEYFFDHPDWIAIRQKAQRVLFKNSS